MQQRDTLTESPLRLSDIIGSANIGDLATITAEFAEAGEYPLGTIMCLDTNGRLVGADGTNNNELYGILLEERIILDIASERNTTGILARRGAFKAEMLTVAQGADIRPMVPILRNLGIYLEGVAAVTALPFRIRAISPDWAAPSSTDVVITVNMDGSLPDNAIVRWNFDDRIS